MGRVAALQHPGRRSAVHGAAVLLEHALRRDASATSATPRAGTASTSHGDLGGARRHARLPARRADAGGRDDRPRSHQPRRRGGDRGRRPGDAGARSVAPAERPGVRQTAGRRRRSPSSLARRGRGGGRGWRSPSRRCSRTSPPTGSRATARRLGLDPYVNHVGSAGGPGAVGRRRALPPQPVPVPAARRGAVPAAGDRSPTARRRSLFTAPRVARLAAGRAAASAGAPGGAAGTRSSCSSPARSSSRSTSTSSAGRSICCLLPLVLVRLARRERAARRGRGARAGGDVQAGAARPAAGAVRARPLALGGGGARRAAPSLVGVDRRDLAGRRWSARIRDRRAAARRALRRRAEPRRCCCTSSALHASTATRRRRRRRWTAVSYRIALPPFDGPATRQPAAPARARRRRHWATSVLPFLRGRRRAGLGGAPAAARRRRDGDTTATTRESAAAVAAASSPAS